MYLRLTIQKGDERWRGLPDNKLSGILDEPARRAPPGLCLHSDFMHLVVMEYVDARSDTPQDVHKQIEDIIYLLHSQGYVFGDLRRPNILFDTHGKVKLIDFNWSGRFDMTICDMGLRNDLQKVIDENKARARVDNESECYAYYPLSMSTLEDMWAPGMKPLAPIRPLHDWKMLQKLSWK